MGQNVQPVSLTSSYSSLQGADRYSVECITQRPHGGITKGSFPLTHPSQVHAISRRMPARGGAHKKEKSLALGQCHCREVSTRQGFFWSAKIEKKGRPLTLWVLLLTGSILLCFSLLRPKEGLLALWFLAFGSGETQKNHLLLNHP